MIFRKNAFANVALFPLEAIPALIALPAELTARNVPLETVHILVRALLLIGRKLFGFKRSSSSSEVTLFDWISDASLETV